MRIPAEIKNANQLLVNLEALETKCFELSVNYLMGRNGYYVTPVGKAQHIKIYVEERHHLIVVFFNQDEKYDTEIVVADDADLVALAKQIKDYLVRPHDLF